MLKIQIARWEGTSLVDEALVALEIGDAGLMWKMAKLMRGIPSPRDGGVVDMKEVLK